MIRRIAVLAVGLGLLAAVLQPWRTAVPPAAVPPAAALPALVAASAVSALGRIEPSSRLIQLGAWGPDVLADLAVDHGAPIHRGQVLGHLQSHAEAAARSDLIAAQLAEARDQLAAEEALAGRRIHAAEIRLAGARAIAPLRQDSQEAAVREAEVDLANNLDILRAQQTLARSNAASKRSYDNQQALVERQRAGLAGLRARLAELKRQSAQDIADAEAGLQVERASLGKLRAAIPVTSLERQLAEAQAAADRRVLRSPIDGMVLNVLVRPGEAVGSGAILSLGNVGSMQAVAEVYETDIGRVRLGQTATISGRALARPLTGRVVEIGRMIYKNDVLNVDPAAKVDARVVEVRVALDDGAAVVGLTNLTVDVRIDTP